MTTAEMEVTKVVDILAPDGKYALGRAALRKEHGVVLANAEKIGVIASESDLQVLVGLGRLLQTASKETETFYKPFKQQIDEMKKPILADEKADAEALEKQKRRLGVLQTEWQENERLAQAERDRIARAEAEKEAQEAALLRAIEVESIEGVEAAEEVLSQPLYVPPVVTQSRFVKASGSVSKTTYKAQVDDLMLLVKAVAAGTVPLVAICANESFLNNQAAQFKDAYNIPGTKLVKTDSTHYRG